MTLSEFRKESQVLTVEKAQELKGKKIAWMYNYDGHEQETQEMVVGDIVSEWEYSKQVPCDGYSSLNEKWEKEFSDRDKNFEKKRMLLLDEEGNNHFIFSDFGVFFCTDIDREVLFVEL